MLLLDEISEGVSPNFPVRNVIWGTEEQHPKSIIIQILSTIVVLPQESKVYDTYPK